METAPGTGPVKLEGNEKLAVELGPLIFFGLGYVFQERAGPALDRLFGTEMFGAPDGELFVAALFFMPPFIAAFIYSVIRTRRVAPMLAVTGVLVTVLYTLTFVFQSQTFVYMKPTLVYGLTAAVLAGGILTGRNFLKMLFDGAFDMPETAWRTLTWRFVAFNAVAAVANEIIWRSLTADCVPGAECSGTDTWVAIKLFGFTIAYFVFVAANAPLIMKHMRSGAAE